VTREERNTTLESHFHQVKSVIEAEDMWDRVPERFRHFSPDNLEGLVKFAYFGGFIDMARARRLLLVDRHGIRQLLTRWYEEIREQGCWLC
jgi:hypothetical protein